jgi:hypothetical protein
MECLPLSPLLTHLEEPMIRLSLPGDHQNKLILNVHWTEVHTKVVEMV